MNSLFNRLIRIIVVGNHQAIHNFGNKVSNFTELFFTKAAGSTCR